jgi:hypothetical protein
MKGHTDVRSEVEIGFLLGADKRILGCSTSSGSSVGSIKVTTFPRKSWYMDSQSNSQSVDLPLPGSPYTPTMAMTPATSGEG